jgi:hypothetical protein
MPYPVQTWNFGEDLEWYSSLAKSSSTIRCA